jgi:hypothetical protein
LKCSEFGEFKSRRKTSSIAEPAFRDEAKEIRKSSRQLFRNAKKVIDVIPAVCDEYEKQFDNILERSGLSTRQCVQLGLLCSAAVSPAGVKVRSPVAWIAG